MRAPPESLSPMMGAPFCRAQSITLQIFSACASDSEPPNTVKSCANTYTSRPSIRPYPVTTPSPRYFSSASPKSTERCVTKRSSSTKVLGSSSASSRSRAVSFPFSCWTRMRSSPPPSSASARFCWSSSSFSRMDMVKNLDDEVARGIGRRRVAEALSGRQGKSGQEMPLLTTCFPSDPLGRLRVCLGVCLCRLLSVVLRPAGRRQHDAMMDRVHLQHLQLRRLPLFHRVGRVLQVGDSEL